MNQRVLWHSFRAHLACDAQVLAAPFTLLARPRGVRILPVDVTVKGDLLGQALLDLRPTFLAFRSQNPPARALRAGLAASARLQERSVFTQKPLKCFKSLKNPVECIASAAHRARTSWLEADGCGSSDDRTLLSSCARLERHLWWLAGGAEAQT